MKWRSARAIFHGPVILPYILKTIWCMNIILWDYESVWPDVWSQNKCRSLWPIVHGPVILPYILKTVWCMNILLRNSESVWPDIWLKINVGHCDQYFMVQWFCFIFWRLFDVWTSYFGIMSQYETTFDLKIIVGHCDLYFMVQWFYLISWRLFAIWTPYFGIMSQYVWPDVWPQNICSTLWPIFHGRVILPNILKTIQWLNIILWDYETVWPDMWPPNICRSLWPILHVPLNLPFILKTVWCMNRILSDYTPSIIPFLQCNWLAHCETLTWFASILFKSLNGF